MVETRPVKLFSRHCSLHSLDLIHISACSFQLRSQAKEDEIRDWLGPAGDIKGLRLNRDKAGTLRT